MRSSFALVALLLALAGCADDRTDTNPPEPTPSQVTPTDSESPTPARDTVRLVDLTAVHMRDARERLTEDGLEVETRVERGCRVLPGIIVDQEPESGAAVPVGDTVTVTVGRSTAAATCARPPARPVTRAFHAWARGEGPAPAFAPQVRLLQGNREVATLGAAEATARDAWGLPAGYAELAEMNLLDWMADEPRLQHSWGLPAFCLARDHPLPDGLVERLGWSSVLVSSSADACLDLGAVQVWVDDADRVEAVGFLIGSP